jgi:RimJ/RimL family protein N-acetyltransferase
MDDIQPPRRIRYQDARRRLVIRPVELSDAQAIAQAVDATLPELRPFMDWAHAPNSIETQQQRIHQLQTANPPPEWALLAWDEATGELLVCTSLGRQRTNHSKAVEIGYWTVHPHQGQGLATLTTQILIVTAFQLGFDRIGIICKPENLRSRRVIEKCGFSFEGEVRHYFAAATPLMVSQGYCPNRSCLQYSLLPTDPLPWYNDIATRTVIEPAQ